ncbi:hypothetical protein NPIL_687781 [Nephila pilipes]|uniref:Uncharacterized protein n=1 Tax=Nephila pilipes TaxID=299642 RepID=A0A8X6NI78_NEPPI|nr:hypothetical protein NPIL_687781 [Nephila pilipes]
MGNIVFKGEILKLHLWGGGVLSTLLWEEHNNSHKLCTCVKTKVLPSDWELPQGKRPTNDHRQSFSPFQLLFPKLSRRSVSLENCVFQSKSVD